jgi:hypothetical protein
MIEILSEDMLDWLWGILSIWNALSLY